MYALYVLLNVYVCLEIGVARALLYLVTDLLAAIATNVLLLLLLVLALGVPSIIIFVVLALVLAKLTARSVFGTLAAAPPHLAAPVTLMRPTRPVVVLLLEVLLAALFADLLVVLSSESSILQLRNALLHLVALHLELLALLSHLLKLSNELLDALLLFLDVGFCCVELVLHLRCEELLLLLESGPARSHLLQVVPR